MRKGEGKKKEKKTEKKGIGYRVPKSDLKNRKSNKKKRKKNKTTAIERERERKDEREREKYSMPIVVIEPLTLLRAIRMPLPYALCPKEFTTSSALILV